MPLNKAQDTFLDKLVKQLHIASIFFVARVSMCDAACVADADARLVLNLVQSNIHLIDTRALAVNVTIYY